ncbi:MAG: Histidine kinase [Bacteroidota bacterium]|jgi:signal transduction histidine kinase
MYWVLQCSGWFAWILNEAVLYTNQYGWHWAWLYASLANMTLAIFLTHQYKHITKQFAWQDLPLVAMLRNHFIALLAMAACLVALNLPIDQYLLGENFEVQLSPFIITQYLFNFMKPLAIWMLIYFFFQYSKKQIAMEREKNLLERAIQETEGKVLRAQMNPHFVFNALNSIRALITEDPTKAKKGINQLSKLLRSSLLTERKKTISIAEELDTIVDYLNLEKIRYEERLTWKLQVAKELHQAQIPPMLLQTLVENAIKHGIAHSSKEGLIEIKGEISGDQLKLQVINPGSFKTRGESTGIGLVNSQNRLTLLFGETAHIDLQPLDKNHVIASVTIPYLAETIA